MALPDDRRADDQAGEADERPGAVPPAPDDESTDRPFLPRPGVGPNSLTPVLRSHFGVTPPPPPVPAPIPAAPAQPPPPPPTPSAPAPTAAPSSAPASPGAPGAAPVSGDDGASTKAEGDAAGIDEVEYSPAGSVRPSTRAPEPASNSAPPPPPPGAPPPRRRHHDETPKETLISIIISFALVFVFTRYVVASYVIPTGSMAPTLMGAHMRFWSAETGDQWSVNPWQATGGAATDVGRGVPLRTQGQVGRGHPPINVDDTFTGAPVPVSQQINVPLRSGDRIFVQKYLYVLSDPGRWDVAVFKYPGESRENYIKRVVGLPGEQLLLADGDVFTRAARSRAPAPPEGDDGASPYRIQRKPARIQRGLWYTLYSSEHRPLSAEHDGRLWRDRWRAPGWTVDGPVYRSDSAAPGEITWDETARPIDDWVSYNDVKDHTWLARRANSFPVGDVRLRAGVEPGADGLSVVFTVGARAHEFAGALENGRAVLRMRPQGEPAPWTTLADEPARAPRPGRVTNIEFWHVDQTLQLWVDGRRVAYAEYDWNAHERLGHALLPEAGHGSAMRVEYYNPANYRRTSASMRFDGAPATLHRVGLDRDIHYQPTQIQLHVPARATAPGSAVTLRRDQYFMLGDNSPNSGDGRVWSGADPWVSALIDPTPGVVPRELIMGKAFLVFWPSVHKNARPLPVPDFGRMRFIR